MTNHPKRNPYIILRSFLRISVVPIIIFTLTVWMVLNLFDSGYAKYGCLSYPEDASLDLFAANAQLGVYLCFTPLLLLNYVKALSQRELLRKMILLLPLIPAVIIFIGNLIYLLNYGARTYLYLTITFLLVIVLVIWNAITVSKNISSVNE